MMTMSTSTLPNSPSSSNNNNNNNNARPRERDELRELSQLLKKYAGHSSNTSSDLEERRRGLFQR
jgi:hypothetical protein